MGPYRNETVKNWLFSMGSTESKTKDRHDGVESVDEKVFVSLATFGSELIVFEFWEIPLDSYINSLRLNSSLTQLSFRTEQCQLQRNHFTWKSHPHEKKPMAKLLR